MIVSAARLHGLSLVPAGFYRRGVENDIQARGTRPRSVSIRRRLYLYFDAFSSREPVSTSLENATRLHDPRRDLAAQPLQTEQRVGAGLRDLDTLGRKMLAEKIEMRRGLMELLRCQHREEHRHFGAH